MTVKEEFLMKIDVLCSLGNEIIDTIKEDQPIKKENLIVYAFLNKTIRLLLALKTLIFAEFEEESQILVRVLVETRINFDYFLFIAKEDYDKAFMRVFDSIMLEKMKALVATDYLIGDSHVDKGKWARIEKEIIGRYDSSEFKQLRRYGFSGLSLKGRVEKTNNQQYYDLVYRMYSRNVHSTDMAEQILDFIMPEPEEVILYEESRINALLQTAYNCSFAIVDNCKNWLEN
jgi:hypothetical protein